MTLNTEKEAIEAILVLFFNYQVKLKMFHFQTTSYGAHKTSDKYLETVLTTFDRFMEVAQGIYGKVQTQNIEIKVKTETDGTITGCIDRFITKMNELSNYYKDQSDLINIKDEIIADANQFKYLLTFK